MSGASTISLTPDTSPAQLERCVERGVLRDVELPAELSAAQLVQIAEVHAATPHGDQVIDRIVMHRNCDSAVLERVLELAGDDSSVQNAVVTSGKAGRALLLRLQTSPHASVRVHVEFALVCMAMDEGDDAAFVDIVQRYRDHDSLGYGVRDALASHPRTPLAILRELATFDDPPGHAARERLARLAEA